MLPATTPAYSDTATTIANLISDYKESKSTNFTIYIVKTRCMHGVKGLKSTEKKALLTAKTSDLFTKALTELNNEHRLKIQENINNFLIQKSKKNTTNEHAEHNPTEEETEKRRQEFMRDLIPLFTDHKSKHYGDSLRGLLAVDPIGSDIQHNTLRVIYQEFINQKRCAYYNGIEGKLDGILSFLAGTEFFLTIADEPFYLMVELSLSSLPVAIRQGMNFEHTNFRRSIHIIPASRSLMTFDKNQAQRKYSSTLVSKNKTDHLEKATFILKLNLKFEENKSGNPKPFSIKFNSLTDDYKELTEVNQEILDLSKHKLGLYNDEKFGDYKQGIPGDQLSDFKRKLKIEILQNQEKLLSLISEKHDPLAKAREDWDKETKNLNPERKLNLFSNTIHGIVLDSDIENFKEKMKNYTFIDDKDLQEIEKKINEIPANFRESEPSREPAIKREKSLEAGSSFE